MSALFKHITVLVCKNEHIFSVFCVCWVCIVSFCVLLDKGILFSWLYMSALNFGQRKVNLHCPKQIVWLSAVQGVGKSSWNDHEENIVESSNLAQLKLLLCALNVWSMDLLHRQLFWLCGTTKTYSIDRFCKCSDLPEQCRSQRPVITYVVLQVKTPI